MAFLAVQFAFPLADTFLQASDSTSIRACVFFGVTLFTFAPLQAIFRVILTNYFFLNELRNKNKNAKIDDLHR